MGIVLVALKQKYQTYSQTKIEESLRVIVLESSLMTQIQFQLCHLSKILAHPFLIIKHKIIESEVSKHFHILMKRFVEIDDEITVRYISKLLLQLIYSSSFKHLFFVERGILQLKQVKQKFKQDQYIQHDLNRFLSIFYPFIQNSVTKCLKESDDFSSKFEVLSEYNLFEEATITILEDILKKSIRSGKYEEIYFDEMTENYCWLKVLVETQDIYKESVKISLDLIAPIIIRFILKSNVIHKEVISCNLLLKLTIIANSNLKYLEGQPCTLQQCAWLFSTIPPIKLESEYQHIISICPNIFNVIYTPFSLSRRKPTNKVQNNLI